MLCGICGLGFGKKFCMRNIFKNKNNIAVVGHFGFGKKLLNGQTIKTENVVKALEKELKCEGLCKIDTHGGLAALLRLPFQINSALKKTENMIVMLAYRGIKLILPIIVFLNRFHKKRIHYIAIGGWLPSMCVKHKNAKKNLSKVDWIYVETEKMKHELNEQGLLNVEMMPNFKELTPVPKETLFLKNEEPFEICTFSRVMKEKGIEDIVNAVTNINKMFNRIVFKLDIYGQIDCKQEAWFKKMESSFPTFVKYCGMVDSDKSVSIIKNYYLLAFPTYYSGEGFAGTLIDAMASGVPIVASDWNFNRDIVSSEIGFFHEARNVDSLIDALLLSIKTINIDMKEKCLTESYKYLPSNAIKVLLKHIA